MARGADNPTGRTAGPPVTLRERQQESKRMLDERARILAKIAANQERWKQTRSLRKRYHLLLENEPLFAALGLYLPPITLPRGPVGWWMRFGAPR